MKKQEYVLIFAQSKNLILQVSDLFETLGWKIVVAAKSSEVSSKWQFQDFKLMLILDVEEEAYLSTLKNIHAAHPNTLIWVAKDLSKKTLVRDFKERVIYMEMGDIEKNLKLFCDLLVGCLSHDSSQNIVNLQPPKKKQLIYSLDDDPAITKILELLFLRLGYNTRIFNDGQVLLEMIKREKPDLLFLDYSMPKMNGAQVLKVVRAIYPKNELPVVFISGTNDSERIQELLEIGINDFIMKPFDENRISEKIKRLVG